jgi:isopentenyl-diphosphate delta-isomerase
LGIESTKLNESKFELITRVHYRADNVPSDGTFGEHEIDYVIFVLGDFELKLNPAEVKAVKYLSDYELKEWIHEETRVNSEIQLTPWFGLIAEKFLFDWWKSIDNLKAIKDYKNIHRFITM